MCKHTSWPAARRRAWLPLWLALSAGSLGCSGLGGDEDSAEDEGNCGDLDGDGTDSGDLPNILGTWTTTFGSETWYDECDITGLGRSDMTWINGAAMTIDGRPPDDLFVEFRDEEEQYWGLENTRGGVVFTGIHEDEGYELNVSFGGLLYHNAYLERDEIAGHGFIGIDVIGDGFIDCGITGNFSARKSGN